MPSLFEIHPFGQVLMISRSAMMIPRPKQVSKFAPSRYLEEDDPSDADTTLLHDVIRQPLWRMSKVQIRPCSRIWMAFEDVLHNHHGKRRIRGCQHFTNYFTKINEATERVYQMTKSRTSGQANFFEFAKEGISELFP